MIAHIDLFFKIPDNFKGDINEILRSIIEYRIDNAKEPDARDYSSEFSQNNSISKSGYDKIMHNNLKNSDKRLMGAVTFINDIIDNS